MNDSEDASKELELTIIAKVLNADLDRVNELARKFPTSNCPQLPPHVTVLSEIFVHPSEVNVVSTAVQQCLMIKTAIKIEATGISVWPFQKYGGFVVSLDVEPDARLVRLRDQIVETVRSKIPRLHAWHPPAYQPHLTLQLSIDQDAADAIDASSTEIAKSHFYLDEVMTLKRGGSFFGWTIVRSTSLSATAITHTK